MTPCFVGHTYHPRQAVQVLERLGFEVLEASAVLHVPRVLLRLWDDLASALGLRALDGPLLGWLDRAETLADWPTRWCTGQYIMVCAERRA